HLAQIGPLAADLGQRVPVDLRETQHQHTHTLPPVRNARIPRLARPKAPPGCARCSAAAVSVSGSAGSAAMEEHQMMAQSNTCFLRLCTPEQAVMAGSSQTFPCRNEN
ncbi:MAG: hypothetical protein KJZ59_04385, partial [Pararhodobacter sp.]|nr:hypothetical protein [Pararhodobacter sp.]